MTGRYEPTERERNVASRLYLVVAALFVLTLVARLFTEALWPVIVFGACVLMLVVGSTVWVSRNRDQSAWRTFVQVLRSKP